MAFISTGLARLVRSPIAWALTAALVGLGACSDEPGADGTSDAAIDSSDGQGPGDASLDMAGDASLTDAGPECPGAPGCPCASGEECAGSGHCIAGPDGTLACAQPCPATGCPDGYACGSLEVAGAASPYCVPRAGRLCDPCMLSQDCTATGLSDTACVDYGEVGAFCGTRCLGDADCGAGYRCAVVARIEGGQTQQCVRAAEGGATGLGVCPCSARAVASKLETGCFASGDGPFRCKGTRACGDAGLSACSASAPATEVCNGSDDDCDGKTDEATCQDENPCTTDTCDPALAVDGAEGCTHTAASGAPCSDGDACTAGDSCGGDGTCKPGAASACDDANPCSDDTCDPVQGCKHAFPDGKPCDADGNGCTEGDACEAGKCLAGKLKACDDKNPCTADACDPGTGTCAAQPFDGATCDDGNKCTIFDTCKAGGCAGQQDTCDDDDPCTTDSCAEGQGCKHEGASGAACDDGDLCTTGETCQTGACGNGQPKACSGGGACATASCDAKTGKCVAKAVADGTVCSDASTCTSDDACSQGKCQGKALVCDDKNPCTTDACSAATGCTTQPNTAGCNDNDACTDKDACADGKCAGLPLDPTKACDDQNPCTDDACDAKSGCTHANNVAGCDDGDACTDKDACAAGKCGGEAIDPAKACDDKNPCTSDACDTKTGCTHLAKAGSCDDGNACTLGDACEGTACAPGTNNVCTCKTDADCASEEDGNACNGTLFCDVATATPSCKVDPLTIVECDTAGDGPCDKTACQPATGACDAVPLPDKATCDDASACTQNDACTAGACKGATLGCDDANPCTDDSCDSKTGCANLPNTATCDADADACTPDTCLAKSCAAGAKKNCDDGNSCTADACDAKTAQCKSTPVTDGTACDDGEACTAGDACAAGSCNVTSVSLLAGSGIAGATDAKGALAQVQLPRGITVDSEGVAYLADTGGHRIRKVLVDGTVSTLAGLGTSGYLPGNAASALFWSPAGVAVAPDGAVFVADTGNQRIRMVKAGEVTTLAGTAPEPDFGAAEAEGAFENGSGDGGRFDSPVGIVLAPDGALYVADRDNHAIRKVTLAGAVTTLAGSGQPGYADGKGASAQFKLPLGIAAGSDGKLYVADGGNARIRIVAADGTVTTLAGSGTLGNQNGAALLASFTQPWGLALDPAGALYVADAQTHSIRRIANGQVTTLAGTGTSGYGNGPFSLAMFSEPSGIAFVSPGLWLVADAMNHRIRKLSDPFAACQGQ